MRLIQTEKQAKPDFLKRKCFVRYGGDVIEVLMDPDEPSIHLKEVLEQQTGIAINDQRIFYNGIKQPFEHEKSLRYYGAQSGGFFDLARDEDLDEDMNIIRRPAKGGRRASLPVPRTESGRKLRSSSVMNQDEVKKQMQAVAEEEAQRLANYRAKRQAAEAEKEAARLAAEEKKRQEEEEARLRAEEEAAKKRAEEEARKRIRNIEVETPDGKIIKVVMDQADTVGGVKEAIVDDCNIPVAKQVLKYQGKALDNNKDTLEALDIPDGTRLTVEPLRIPVTINNTVDGSQIKMLIDPTEPLSELQKPLVEESGIPVNNQNLSMNGKDLLDPKKTATDYSIKAGSIIDLSPKTIQVHVNTPDKKTVTLTVKPSKKTLSLKEKLVPQTDLAVSQQVLNFNGKEMPNGNTMNDMGIKDGAVLDLNVLKVPITVNNLMDGSQIKLMIDPTKPISEFQQPLEKESGIPMDNQKLSLNGKELEDANRVAANYGIKAGSVLDLEPKTIQVHVKTPDNDKTITLSVKPSDTTLSLKEKLVPQTGLTVPQQVLSFNGKEMANSNTMKNVGIKDGSVLDLSILKVPITVNNTMDGNQIKMMIDPTKPIADLQQPLEKESGIPVDNQKLSMNGKELLDPTKAATECGIKAGSVLDLEPKTIKVHVKTPEGKTITLTVKPSDSTLSIKEEIAPETGLPVDQQALSFNGKEMPNEKTMKELGVKDGSVLQVGMSEAAKQQQAEAAARKAEEERVKAEAEAKAEEEAKKKKKKKKDGYDSDDSREFPVHKSKDYSHEFNPTPLDLSRFRVWFMIGDQVPFEMICPIAMDIKGFKEEILKLRNEARFVEKYFEGLDDPLELKVYPAGSYGEGDPLPDDIPVPKNSDEYKMFYVIR